MSKKKLHAASRQSSLPSLATHAAWSVLTCLFCMAFLFALAWQQETTFLKFGAYIINLPMLLSAVAAACLLGSILLWVMASRLFDYKTTSPNPQRATRINRVMRADAYTYLLLPLLIIAMLAWEQIGNIVLLSLLFLLTLLFFKTVFFMELKKLSKN